MREPKHKKALETGSGITWQEWLKILEPHRKLSHTEMARVVLDEISKVGKSNSPEWWAQGITVAYEQHIGRRQVGQTCAGDFSVTVSKTFNGDMDAALASWIERTDGQQEFNGCKITDEPRVSQTDAWRYWRCNLANDSKVSVNIQTKPSGQKSTVSINHDKLQSAEDVERWRIFWKEFSNRDVEKL